MLELETTKEQIKLDLNKLTYLTNLLEPECHYLLGDERISQKEIYDLVKNIDCVTNSYCCTTISIQDEKYLRFWNLVARRQEDKVLLKLIQSNINSISDFQDFVNGFTQITHFKYKASLTQEQIDYLRANLSPDNQNWIDMDSFITDYLFAVVHLLDKKNYRWTSSYIGMGHELIARRKYPNSYVELLEISYDEPNHEKKRDFFITGYQEMAIC